METIDIEFVSGPNAGQSVRLSDRTLIFGRTTVSDIVLDWDGLVSSRHFKIQKEGDRFVLHDLGSTNGTLINGEREEACSLKCGDKIVVGKTTLVVRADVRSEEEARPAATNSRFNPFESSIIIAMEGVQVDVPNETRGPIAHSNSRFNPFESGIVITTDDANVNEELERRNKVPTTNTSSDTANTVDLVNASPISNHENSAKKTGIVQLRLRVTSQIELGRKFWLSLGQSSTFGRTERADFSFASDSSLSGEHFRVTCTAERCEIEDLQSRGGTWLNGKKINRSALHDGDHLLAGKTEFSVEIDGVVGAARRTASVGVMGAAIPSARPRTTPKQVYDVSKSQCASGILRLRGKVREDDNQEEAGIVEFFETMHAHAPIQLLIDFSRISLPFPEEMVAEEHSLFEWLPPGSIEKSPMLFALDELALWKSFVEEAWGSDAVIGLRSELPRAELLAKFQDLLMGSSHGPEASKGILGFCWPSVLEALMENNSNGFTDSFFADVSLVLIEKQGKPEYWQLFGHEAAIEQVTKIGMRIERDSREELVASKTS